MNNEPVGSFIHSLVCILCLPLYLQITAEFFSSGVKKFAFVIILSMFSLCLQSVYVNDIHISPAWLTCIYYFLHAVLLALPLWPLACVFLRHPNLPQGCEHHSIVTALLSQPQSDSFAEKGREMRCRVLNIGMPWVSVLCLLYLFCVLLRLYFQLGLHSETFGM